MNKKPVSTLKGAHYLKTAICILSMIIIFVALNFANNNYAIFQVKDYFSDEIFFKRYMKIGENFTLAYTHSVTNRPVYEEFTVLDKKTLALVEMRYDSFGANLPVGPEILAYETTQFLVEQDHYKIIYENRTFEKVPLRVGQVVANHTLIFADEAQIPLMTIANGGALVELYIKPLIGD